LPEGWTATRLGDAAEATRSTTDPRDSPDEVFDYFSIPAFQSSGQPVSESGRAIRSQKLIVHNGMVLFGKLNPRVPKVWLVASVSTERKIASTEFIPLRPLPGVVTSEFLYFLCQTNYVLHAAEQLVSGSTPSRQRVDTQGLLETLVPVPSVQEQRAIAHVLSTVQRAREAAEAVVAAARELKRSLMRHLFTYGPVPPAEAERVALKETEIGPVPEHWAVSRLGTVAKIERGRFAHRPRNDPAYYGGTVPFIQTGDVTASGGRIARYTQTLNSMGLSVSRVFPKRTVVITIAANIGYTGILEFDSAFPDSLIGITPYDGILNEFLNYYLMTQQAEMDRLAPRGTQKNINIRFLAPWPTPVPPLGEQERVRDILAAVDHKIEAEEKQRAALDALFRSLLQQLMTGRLRVTLATRPPTWWG